MLSPETRRALEDERLELQKRADAIGAVLGEAATTTTARPVAGLGPRAAVHAVLDGLPAGLTPEQLRAELTARGSTLTRHAINGGCYQLRQLGRIRVSKGRLVWVAGARAPESTPSRGRRGPAGTPSFRAAVIAEIQKRPGLTRGNLHDRLAGVPLGGGSSLQKRLWVELSALKAGRLVREMAGKKLYPATGRPHTGNGNGNGATARRSTPARRSKPAKAKRKTAWTSMTPAQRSEEMKRRARVRNANRKPKASRPPADPPQPKNAEAHA